MAGKLRDGANGRWGSSRLSFHGEAEDDKPPAAAALQHHEVAAAMGISAPKWSGEQIAADIDDRKRKKGDAVRATDGGDKGEWKMGRGKAVWWRCRRMVLYAAYMSKS